MPALLRQVALSISEYEICGHGDCTLEALLVPHTPATSPIILFFPIKESLKVLPFRNTLGLFRR